MTATPPKALDLSGFANNDYPYTLGEVGKELGLTREGVRQLQNVALRKFLKGMERKGFRLEDLI
jgi:DNA-directed RNA polymerase sigma subunit (sigma70/sigma32)